MDQDPGRNGVTGALTIPVAVVVPARNAAPWLEVALRSVQQQTALPAELVVVDDGSTDDTAAIAERLGVRAVRQQQRGPGAARNRGIAETKAEFIAFLDADDWYAPSKLEREHARLQELGASCVCSDAWVVRGSAALRCKNEGRQASSVLTLEQLLVNNSVICSTVVARRDAIAAAGGFDEDPVLIATEDYDLWLRMARREPLAYLHEPLAFYRVHDANLSNSARFLHGVDRILDKVAHSFGQEPHFARLIRQRRAGVRLDVAWDLLRAGRKDDARTMLADARKHAFTWKGTRMWLRSFVGGAARN